MTDANRSSLSVAMVGLRGIPASYGGVEAAVEALSAGLVDRGNAVTVYARTSYTEDRPSEYRGVALRYLPQVNTKHLEAATHTALAVADAVRRGFDVIHIHATGPALFSPVPRLARVPCVATVHAFDWQREKWGRAASAALRLGARVAATVPNRTIVVSQGLGRQLRERYGASPVYIPNGVDAATFDAVAPVAGLSPGFLLFFGRLVPEKGVHTLIEAYRSARLEQPLVIAGPASHSAPYVRSLHELADGDPRIEFVGPRFGPERAWLLRNAGLFVQPSTLEGMPITLLEALACGRPAVVSDIPEHIEMIERDRELALTFRAGDAGDLAATLTRASAEAAELDPARVGALLAPFDWARIAADTEAVYREAIADVRSSRRRGR